jgi:hypothetical protein
MHGAITSGRCSSRRPNEANAGPLGISREQLAELERELKTYLAFWALARTPSQVLR